LPHPVLEEDISRRLARTRNACQVVDITVYHSQNNIRKRICHDLCSQGFRAGFVKRRNSTTVQVLVVFPSGINADFDTLARYFGTTWGVTREEFQINNNCTEQKIVELLRKPFYLFKPGVDDPENRSDENFDYYSSDDGGYEVRSVNSFL